MTTDALGWWGVPVAIVAGALRGSTPFLLVSLGECLNEKSGKINLGLEGTVLLGAVSAFAVSLATGSPWLGLAAAMGVGMVLGGFHAWLADLPRVNDTALGIAMILLGTGAAFSLGKPYIEPTAPQLPVVPLGGWSSVPQIQAALGLSPLWIFGVLLAPVMAWFFRATRWGLMVRSAGDDPLAARALGISVRGVRALCLMTGGALAALGGANLSLHYPGSWNEGISSGQGLIAVALVIFAKWNPVRCIYAALLFGGAQALGPALQAVGVTSGYYLFNASPYVLTLVVMLLTSSAGGSLAGAPGALGRKG
jgi:simple sugar transport system permease protein